VYAPLVLSQMTTFTERFVTNVARIWFVSCVDSLVEKRWKQVAIWRFTSGHTQERNHIRAMYGDKSFSNSGHLTVYQWTHSGDNYLTYIARIRFFSRVCSPLLNHKITTVTEILVTYIARIWFLSHVRLPVLSQITT